MKLVTFFGLVAGKLISDAFMGKSDLLQTTQISFWMAVALLTVHIYEKINNK